MKKIKVRIDEEKVIERKPKVHQVGNFQIMTVRYNNKEYIVGDGDEYIRGGYDQEFTLGREV